MRIDDVIDKDFSGCISVVKNGKIVFRRAYGYADLPNKIENEIDTRFGTASAGKVFVAVGILRLIEEGRLRFDDTIGGLLGFDWKQIDREITVRQLLCHTSGIPDYFDEGVMTEYAELWKDYPNYKIRTSSDIIPLFIDKPMMYPAGQKFQYNNTGYVVLGMIIEKITGEPFDLYLAEKVFGPCGMKDTGYFEMDRLPARCANAYIFDEARSEYYTNIYSVDVKGTGAGGAFTNVEDIDLFWDSLMTGRLISPGMLKQMLSAQSGDGSSLYGYGIWLAKTGINGLLPYFQGSDPGVSFISCYDTTHQVRVTAVSNFESNVWQLEKDIMKTAQKI